MLLDSGVVIRALEHQNPRHANDPRTIEARALWEAALRTPRVTLLIAAPSVVEFRVGPNAVPLPLVSGLEYVAFTAPAAEDMATWAASDVVKQIRTKHGETRQTVSYDALIVACARFAKADCIVTLDADVFDLADLAGIPAHPPKYFRKAQPILPNVPP